MKTHLVSMRVLALVNVMVSWTSSYGRIVLQSELDTVAVSGIEAVPAIQNLNEEAALLEELKGYRLAEDNPDNDARISGILQALAEFGSTNALNFFLDNLGWPSRSGVSQIAGRPPVSPRPALNTYGALIKMKEIPLRPFMDILLGEDEWTAKFEYFSILTYQIHGEGFLREVEALIETFPDTDKRIPLWEGLAERMRHDLEIKKSSVTIQEPSTALTTASQPDTPSVGCDDLGAPSAETPDTVPPLPPPVTVEEPTQFRLWLCLGVGILAVASATLLFVRKKKSA